MLPNVYRDRPTVHQGTRLLQSTYGVVGQSLLDLSNYSRIWTITALYAPIPGRALGGVRAKLVDQLGTVTFCNQRDLEVMLGVGQPGTMCSWLGSNYVDETSDKWMGLCCDDEDLLDDTFEKECQLRQQTPSGVLASPLDFTRRIYGYDEYGDALELYVFISDVDPNTGYYPDTRIETVHRRWIRSEIKRVRWDR